MIEDGSGRIYLMDFGIAKQGGDARADAGGRLRRHGRLRRAGADRGEGDHRRRGHLRVRRRPLRGLTGKKPYERDTDVAVMFAHITEPPPKVTEARPELPEALDAVIARAMAKAPEERYATCREMIEAARAALGGAARPTPGAARRWPGGAAGRRRRGRTCPCPRRRSSAATTSSRPCPRCSDSRPCGSSR